LLLPARQRLTCRLRRLLLLLPSLLHRSLLLLLLIIIINLLHAVKSLPA
jgi:hypothetical protein